MSEDNNTSQNKNIDDLNQNGTTEPQGLDFDPFFDNDEIGDLPTSNAESDGNNNTDNNSVAQNNDAEFAFDNEINFDDLGLDEIANLPDEQIAEQNQEQDQDLESLLNDDKPAELDDNFLADFFSQDTQTEKLPQDQEQEIEALFDAENVFTSEPFSQDQDIDSNIGETQENSGAVGEGFEFESGSPDNPDLGGFEIPAETPETIDLSKKEKEEPKKIDLKKKTKREKGNSVIKGWLSAIAGSKPIGVEGYICVVVFSILLLLLIFMNLQATIWHPVGISSLSMILYVVLLNLFGICGLLVPAWMFASRGTKDDKREMKERNDVFKAMLGVGLMMIAIGAILLVFEFYRYDFTIKSEPFKPVQIPNAESKIPEITPNTPNPEP
ncbi:MAG: hypothetical protein LBJ67_08880 [Planctomycetaceae bacterium]|nr:hypothetical protein [Planctomycetaceae bacterium]